MAILSAFYLPLYATVVEARRGLGGISVGRGLNPLDVGILGVSIPWASFSFLQLLSALKNFKKRPAEDDYPRRTGAATLLALATFCIMATWTLKPCIVSVSDSSNPSGMLDVVERLFFSLAHVLFIGTLFVILDWRAHQQAVQYGHAKSKQFAKVVRFGVPILLFVMLAFSAGRAGVEGSLGFFNELVASQAFSHVFVVFYVLAVIATVGTTIVLWTNKRPELSTLQITQFDEMVLKRILYNISPFLVIQAVYELIADIVLSTVILNPQVLLQNGVFRQDQLDEAAIRLPPFQLAEVIIEGVIFLWIIAVALGLGVRPKKKGEAGQTTAEVKG